MRSFCVRCVALVVTLLAPRLASAEPGAVNSRVVEIEFEPSKVASLLVLRADSGVPAPFEKAVSVLCGARCALTLEVRTGDLFIVGSTPGLFGMSNEIAPSSGFFLPPHSGRLRLTAAVAPQGPFLVTLSLALAGIAVLGTVLGLALADDSMFEGPVGRVRFWSGLGCGSILLIAGVVGGDANATQVRVDVL